MRLMRVLPPGVTPEEEFELITELLSTLRVTVDQVVFVKLGPEDDLQKPETLNAMIQTECLENSNLVLLPLPPRPQEPLTPIDCDKSVLPSHPFFSFFFFFPFFPIHQPEGFE